MSEEQDRESGDDHECEERLRAVSRRLGAVAVRQLVSVEGRE